MPQDLDVPDKLLKGPCEIIYVLPRKTQWDQQSQKGHPWDCVIAFRDVVQNCTAELVALCTGLLKSTEGQGA